MVLSNINFQPLHILFEATLLLMNKLSLLHMNSSFPTTSCSVLETEKDIMFNMKILSTAMFVICFF